MHYFLLLILPGIPIAIYFDFKRWKINGKSKILQVYSLFISIIALIIALSK